MNTVSIFLKIQYKALLIFTIIFLVASIIGCTENAPKEKLKNTCKDTGSASKVNCDGICPYEERPNCYVSFRRAGSEDGWEYSGFSSLERTQGIEYDCYCDK